MNIHPAFVHFPIALLMIYALIELLPVRKILPSIAWNIVSPFLLYVGAVAAVVTAITGMLAEMQVGESDAVEAHAGAAMMLVAVASITAVLTYLWKGETAVRTAVMKLLAAAIAALLFIVGALGANIVYGSGVDPIVTFVTRVFGVQ